MRAFVTGGTGFIGGHVVRRLRERGDEVVALVRSPSKSGPLRDLGCELIEGDLGDTEAIRRGLKGCDSAFHIAAIYKVGVPRSERNALFDANVRGTERVLDAAIDAGVSRMVYVSTIGIFGNTRGKVVDETYERPPRNFLTVYEETKWLAHQAAVDRIRDGAPIVVVQPGGVYGPDDPSDLGTSIELLRTGKLRFRMFPESGFNFLHVEDAAEGILLAHDKGRIGESYVLGGELATLGKLIDTVCHVAGRKPPRVTLPGWVAAMGIPFGRLIHRVMGLGPNMREMIRAARGVTYWATDDKARRELGYSPRDLETGLRQTLGV